MVRFFAGVLAGDEAFAGDFFGVFAVDFAGDLPSDLRRLLSALSWSSARFAGDVKTMLRMGFLPRFNVGLGAANLIGPISTKVDRRETLADVDGSPLAAAEVGHQTLLLLLLTLMDEQVKRLM